MWTLRICKMPASSHESCMQGCTLRASPPVHWKLACTPRLDEVIHCTGVKVGAGTPDCCQILGFQETRENKKHCCYASRVFAFAAPHTYCYWLVRHTNWPTLIFTWFLSVKCLLFTRLWVGREKFLTQNLDVKTWRAGPFPVNRWRCS